MRILIGCEESQVITKLMRAAGHEAYSCDLEPTRGNRAWHMQADIIETLECTPDGYYDLIILHPVCDYMGVCGNRWYGRGTPGHQKRLKAVEWTTALWELAKKKGLRVAMENPKSVIFPILRRMGATVQYIHPWQHGHLEQKETGLALHNLPEIIETDNVYDEMMKLTPQEREKVFRMAPGPNRKRDRSKTYEGIGKALVNQWTHVAPTQYEIKIEEGVMAEIWKYHPGECDHCGNDIEIFTDEEEEEGYGYDGDLIRCVGCGAEGSWSVYDFDDAYVNWWPDL